MLLTKGFCGGNEILNFRLSVTHKGPIWYNPPPRLAKAKTFAITARRASQARPFPARNRSRSGSTSKTPLRTPSENDTWMTTSKLN